MQFQSAKVDLGGQFVAVAGVTAHRDPAAGGSTGVVVDLPSSAHTQMGGGGRIQSGGFSVNAIGYSGNGYGGVGGYAHHPGYYSSSSAHQTGGSNAGNMFAGGGNNFRGAAFK